MREIKFRGFSESNKGFICGALIDFSAPNCLNLSAFFRRHLNGELDSGTISQYTGLKDKNDVEIYEGDIVTSKIFGVCEVRWYQNAFALWDAGSFGRAYSNFLHDSVEVIGNIYQNKELLSEEKQNERN